MLPIHAQESRAYHDSFDVTTVSYRAPEIVYGAEFGSQIDIWAAGVTLAELFCGRSAEWIRVLFVPNYHPPTVHPRTTMQLLAHATKYLLPPTPE